MHFLSLATVAASPETLEQFAALAGKNVPQDIGIILLWVVVIIQFVVLLSYWFASMMVARNNCGFTNAIKIWVLYIISFIALGIGTLVAILILVSMKNESTIVWVVTGVSILWLLIVVGIPMKVYEIGLFRAVAFLILALIIAVIGDVALTFVPGNPQVPFVKNLATLKVEDWRHLWMVSTKRFAVGAVQAATDTLPGELIAGDRSKSLEERQAALKIMYAELDRRRAAIKAEDKAAVEHYSSDLERYNNLRNQLSTDASTKSEP